MSIEQQETLDSTSCDLGFDRYRARRPPRGDFLRMRYTMIVSTTTDPPLFTLSDLASRALTLDTALSGAQPEDLPVRQTETALLRDWLQQLAKGGKRQ